MTRLQNSKQQNAWLILAVVLLSLSMPGVVDPEGLYAQQVLDIEIAADLRPMYHESDEYPLSRETAVRDLLEQARYTVSGMIYGFRFRYVPSDTARAVAEEFELDAVAEIPWGDPALFVRETRESGDLLFATVRYELKEFQERRVTAWLSSRFRVSGGAGSAPIIGGNDARRVAVEQALRNAVRESARSITRDKPSEVRGRLVLAEPPRVYLQSGQYHATVRTRIEIQEITPYRSF